MKRIIAKFFAVIMLFAISLNASAYDFEVDGIYYNIISTGNLTCKVTYKNLNNQTNSYTDTLKIPATINYKNREWSVVSIGDSAFFNCSNLKKIVLHSEINSIGASAFEKCTMIEMLDLPKSIISISKSAFKNCTKLTQITLPSKIIYIEAEAFYNCTMLDNIYLPQSITSIGEKAFYGCSNLSNISIPTSIKVIEPHTFGGCSKLSSISLPDSLNSIGERAFAHTKIESIIIPNQVLRIEKNAFVGCTSLLNIQLPQSLQSITDSMFYNCTKLEKIVIPKNVTSIKQSAFFACPNLKELIIDPENKVYDSRDNANAVIHSSTNALLRATASTIIPNSVTSISSYAFSDVSIKELTIPATVLEIENYAFNKCRKLKRLIIADSNSILKLGYSEYSSEIGDRYSPVTRVKIYALFRDCNLSEVYIGRNLSYYIPDDNYYIYELLSSPFSGKPSLVTINFGINVTEIGYALFEKCYNLQNIKIPNNCKQISAFAFANTKITKIEIPKSVTNIIAGAFYETPLTEAYFENGYDDIYIGSGNFNLCNKIFIGRPISRISNNKLFPIVENVTIGDSVKSIKSDLFENCTTLKTLDLGGSLETIGDNAFSGCENIKQITSRNSIPPTNAMFPNTVYMDANVIVPKNALETYKSDFNWQNFWNISGRFFFSTIDSIITNETHSIVDVYTLQGLLVRKGVKREDATQGLPQGVYIIGGEKVIVK